MAAKRAIHHRIFEVTTTLLILAVATTVRSFLAPAADELIPNVATPLSGLLQRLQTDMPVLSAVVWGTTLFLAGLNTGRYGVKYSLYPAYTLMSIPLFGVVAATVAVSGDYLTTSLATTLMLLGSKYLMRCIMRNGGYGDLSLSMLCFGALPLVFAPAAAVVYGAMPLLILVVKPRWRDWIVAVASLAFPLPAQCYIAWCGGAPFAAVAQDMREAMLAPSGFDFYRTLNPAAIFLIGIILVMVLCSVSLIVSDRYSLKVKSRAVMRFNALLLLLTSALFLLPSATPTLFALIAVPTAILLPLMFVRMGTGFTETLYRLLLAAVAANIVVSAM